MEISYLSSLLIGIMVMLSIFLSLSRAFDIRNKAIKKALALFSAAAGILTTFWLQDHPDVLRDYSEKIVLAGLAVVITLTNIAGGADENGTGKSQVG
jgi:hypothetical protein